MGLCPGFPRCILGRSQAQKEHESHLHHSIKSLRVLGASGSGSPNALQALVAHILGLSESLSILFFYHCEGGLHP